MSTTVFWAGNVANVAVVSIFNNPTREEGNSKPLTNRFDNLANIYFASASQAIDHLPKGAALAVKLASALYQQIGFQLIHTQYHHNERRCYVTSFSKLLITLKIITKFLITFKAKLNIYIMFYFNMIEK